MTFIFVSRSKTMRPIFNSALLLMVLPLAAASQARPGTNIKVTVHVDSIERASDSLRFRYRVINELESAERLFEFTVDAPGGVLSVSTPEPVEKWVSSTRQGDRPVASWGVLGNDLMQPGSSSPQLRVLARGLPGIVMYWAGGWFPPIPLGPTDTLPVVEAGDPLTENSVSGKTVGVDPMPSDPAPASLVNRLRGLLAESCQLGWITAPACGPLDAQLAAGTAALAGESIPGAREALTSFVDEVTGGFDASGSGAVNDAAFWLLTVNVDFILSLLPADGGSQVDERSVEKVHLRWSGR